MRAENIKAGFQRVGAYVQQNERLAVRVRPNLIARLELASLCNCLFERLVALGFCKLDCRCGALSLGFVIRDEIDVIAA